MAHRINISLDKQQLSILRRIKGLGNKDAEIVKNLILAYLSEKGYIEQFNRRGDGKI